MQVLAESTGRRIEAVPETVARETALQMRGDDAESARLHLGSIMRILDAEEPRYRT